jgi:hypothetical protein
MLCFLCFAAVVGCDQPASPTDATASDTTRKADAPAVRPQLNFSEVTVGDWETLAGVVKIIDGSRSDNKVTYRFEVQAVKRGDHPNAIQIKWSNDDFRGPEQGEFLVPFDKQLALSEYRKCLEGPFGAGRIVKLSPDVYKIAERSFQCWRVESRLVNEYGSDELTLWLSNEAPAARIVACRSSWQPAPNWADRSPPATMQLELANHGTR